MDLITSEWDPGNRGAVQTKWAQSMRAAVLCCVHLVVRVHDNGVVSLNLHRHAGVNVRLCLRHCLCRPYSSERPPLEGHVQQRACTATQTVADVPPPRQNHLIVRSGSELGT